jgi:uncharacterized protein involved in exopolysaccharide biosynthesis
MSGAGSEGITRRVILNILEAFFRRPWLYLLPLLLFSILGASTAMSTTEQFSSVGTMNATSGSLFSELTQSANQPGFGFSTPASVTASNLNQLLRTEEFQREVADRADLTEALDGGFFDLGDIYRSTSAYDDGDNLVRVQSTTGDPQLSEKFATAAIAAFIQWQIDRDVGESTTAERILESQVAAAEERLDAAQNELDTYFVENQVGPEGERPLAQQLQIDRLSNAAQRAEDHYVAQVDRLDEAKLTTAQTKTVVESRLRLVDEPTFPLAPEPRLRKAVMTFAVFIVLGLIISTALVVLVAALDRTIRVPNDVEAKFGLDVLAVVPETSR